MHNDPPATINANDALDQPDLPPQYLPISRLGQGGMGEVWKVEQRNDNKFVRYVAAKLLPRDSINYDAFERELNTAVRFQHPRILPIHDFGKTLSGRPFIIMQLAQQSLAARLSAGTIDTETLLRWLGQIAEALDHVHGAGYLHRDVKPANILLDQGDAFLADFGIAELVGSETSLSGTQAYMSPEQAAGSTLDARADVFALAVTACECLSGKRTRRPDELIASKGIRPAMVAVLQAALDLDPAKRPGRASLFIEQLVRASRRGRNLYNVSPLPPQFVARETQMAELRAALLNRKPDHRIALTAIDGAGGIGKSMLSLALCHDSAVQDAYSDGIFWVDIGKKPSPIVEKLRAIGMAFHDTPAYYQSEDTAKTRLDELLADKAILIILDDVWDADYIKPFQFASPRSCTLFSTRNRRFYKKVGAVEVAVPPPTLSEAIAMLKHYAERDDASFTAIAERMGRLPLALKLIGARLKEQPTLTGSEWLARFQHVTELKEGYNSNRRDDNLAVCLELSVDALDEQAKPLYYALGIFPEDVWVPQAVISRLWREQNPALSENDAIGLALELEALALIDRRAGDDTLILHDLLHDYNREKLDNRLISTHAALLHAYNPMSKPWPEVPHDGYLYFQLAYHLRETGRKEALYELLTDSRAWMDAKFAACSDHTAYMADLDLALTDFVEPFFADDLIRVVQFHGARQVVSAQVDIYQDIDLQTLVWLGKGTEALAHARMRTQLQKRVSGLLGIIKICVECHQPADDLYEEALINSEQILSAADRANAQSAIAAALAQAGDSRAQTTFAQALDSAAALEDASSLAQSDIAAALVAVGKLQQAFQVLGNQSFPAYMQFLSALAPAAEKIEPGLFARVVYEAARILSWQRKTWEPLRNALKPAVDETAKPTVSPAPPSNVLAVAMQSSVRKLRRESLLIGIGNYVWQSYLPSLASVAPAQEVLQTCMSAVGWRLRSLADTQSPTSEYFPTLDNLIAEIEGLPSGIDLLWLHFCGYADVFSNEPYLFVQDSTELNKTRRALSLIDLRRMLQKVAPQSALVTLDTYPPHRDDGATEIAKDEFLSAAKDALRGMAVIAGRTWSGTARSLSGQPMSVFTSFLADALSDPAAQLGGALTVGQLADYMRNMLSEWRADHPGTILRPVFQVEGFENLVLADQRLAE